MRKKTKPGDLIKIPYQNEWHVYGRVLEDESYAIYDFPSRLNDSNYDQIIQADILFIAMVDVFAIAEGYWEIITNIPLEDRLKNFFPRYFNPSPTNLGFYNVYKDDIENAIAKDWIKTGKIQLGGIHGHVHVESRIRDYYNGKTNEFNLRNIQVFKHMSGIS